MMSNNIERRSFISERVTQKPERSCRVFLGFSTGYREIENPVLYDRFFDLADPKRVLVFDGKKWKRIKHAGAAQ